MGLDAWSLRNFIHTPHNEAEGFPNWNAQKCVRLEPRPVKEWKLVKFSYGFEVDMHSQELMLSY